MTPQTKDIEGLTYTVHPLDAVSGAVLFARLAQKLAPVADELDDTDTIRMGEILGALLRALDPGEVKNLIDTFAPKTFVKLDAEHEPQLKSIIEVHFAANYDAMFQWLWFCLEMNYGPFLRARFAKAKDLAARFNKQPPKPAPH